MKHVVMAAVAAAMVSGVAQAETVAVTADRLLDVATGKYVEKPLVLITNGKIVSISPLAATTIPQGTKTVDLGATTLVPGLIDMHTHLEGAPELGGYTGLQYTDSFHTFTAPRNAKDTLEAGFTTVRSLGTSPYVDVGLKQAIDMGYLVGPRVIPAGSSFGATGGHCDSTYFPPSMKQASEFNADSPEEGRKVVRTLRKYGAEVIKICATGGVFSRNTEPGQQQLSLADMTAIVEEAHMWGLKVAAHAHGAAGIKDAIRAGVDTIEHVSLVDDEGIRLAKAKGAWFSMDIYNTEYTQSEGAKNGVLEDNLRKDREIAEIQRNNFRKAHAAGVKMVYGTDTGVYPHKDSGKQFAIMVRYGMTPLEAIRTATLNAAEALARPDVGQIKVGAWGDMVAVSGDPLSDVRALEKPVAVIKGGVVVKGPN
ncbi:amidohydrolase family protein [Caulobacter segnis]|uniref:Xaa-Pro dipeptidase n=1 Tax=Caulobacter segnis TaxID=88688 RepID=UPI00240FCC0F|nr:amidohydrolase family protein [Caulobacter segnis]MDG2520174.1 amidohydrolase family protein [Caulobacter segnis]